jgi:hypothetical protein
MTSPAKPERNYAPDFVSTETLAHRLDCLETTVHNVRRGLLPKPLKIGPALRIRLWAEILIGQIAPICKDTHIAWI